MKKITFVVNEKIEYFDILFEEEFTQAEVADIFAAACRRVCNDMSKSTGIDVNLLYDMMNTAIRLDSEPAVELINQREKEKTP